MKKLILIFFAILSITAGAIAFKFSDQDLFLRITNALELFGSVFREVTLHYVDPVDPMSFVNDGTKAMLSSLDPYSEILDDSGEDDMELLSTNIYTGFGMVIGVIDDMLTIMEVYPGYSAEKNGLKPGDRICYVDTLSVLHDTTNIIRSFSRGNVGGSVKVALLRPGKSDTIRVTLTREIIRVKSLGITGMVNDSIGYISIERFSTGTKDEVKRSLALFRREHPAFSGLILDLRGNPGGLLESAVDICDLFVPMKSTIVVTKGRSSEEERVYLSQYNPQEPDIPLAILIDGESASASEVMAGAIQDLDRGIILGSRSFGKGLVQTVMSLPGNKSLKLTTARYYTPSGRCIQKLPTYAENIDIEGREVQFKTVGGRPVTSRHGIAPDTILESPYNSQLLTMLDEEQLLFRFVSEYCANIDTLSKDWKASDKELKKLQQWLGKQDDLPLPEPYALLEKSDSIAQKNGYSSAYAKQLRNLRNSSKKDMLKGLNAMKPHILRTLTLLMQARYRDAKEMIPLLFNNDYLVQKTAMILRSKQYKTLLSPR
ncbi:MAG: S41 family peptidase [Ignavibacteria bacterium]|nr:S41 family peptidase [Ignavibacteria bacterium]